MITTPGSSSAGVRDHFASGVIYWQISSIDQAQEKKGFWLVCKNIGVKEISHEMGDVKKHRKNCECCPGHHLIVNHYSSMS